MSYINTIINNNKIKKIIMNTFTHLSESALRKTVPTAFFDAPEPFMSEKYTLIKTTDVITRLANYGWLPVEASESQTFANTKKDARHHMIRFRKPSILPAQYVGDSVPEIVLINSNNGRKAFQLEAGIFRLVCSNGMVRKDKDLGSVKKVHIGEFDLDNAIHDVLFKINEQASVIQKLQTIELHPAVQLALAKKALDLRFKDSVYIPDPKVALEARRVEDEGNSAWLVLNRLQEAILTGGIALNKIGGGTKVAKPVTSPSTQVKLNQELFSLVEAVAL